MTRPPFLHRSIEAITHELRVVLGSLGAFSRASGIRLRSYQLSAGEAIVDSVLQQKGRSFVVMFPRQSGKNELQAQLEAWLLMLYSLRGGEIVKLSPTRKPQSITAMRRLEDTLERNPITLARISLDPGWKRAGYIYRIGQARITFLSASPTTNVVGATASLLLECDEAQDVSIGKWDREIGPMAASTNATKVFWGTAWTSHTLLAREKRLAEQAQQEDGVQRVFVVDADRVGMEVPAYKAHVAEAVRRYGRSHPAVRTQYFSEEIDEQAGMFPASRTALMQGSHPSREAPEPGKVYALLVDVAGEDAGLMAGGSMENTRRDATAVTVVEIGMESVADPVLQAPTYRVQTRRQWTGEAHTSLYAQIKALAEGWGARWIVADSTGVGAGLVSFLRRSFGADVVIPYSFNTATKSRLGWDFLSVVETGRFKDHAPAVDGSQDEVLRSLFLAQARACTMNHHPGPDRRLSWGVPANARNPYTGELLHDDLLLSAALCAVLDHQPHGAAESQVVQPEDPFAGYKEIY